MAVLVTGATGFIGSHLIRELREREGLVILLKDDDPGEVADKCAPQSVRYHVSKCDFRAVMELHGVDCLIHLATNYGNDGNSPAELVADNVEFPLRLLDAALDTGVACFINTDTFFSKPAFDYEHLRDYSRTKRQFLAWFENSSGRLARINLRLEHVYGPRDGPRKFIPWLARTLLANPPELDLTDGTQRRDFIHVADVVRAFRAVLDHFRQSGEGFRELQVGTGSALPLRQLVETMKELAGARTRLNFGALPTRDGEITCSEADTSCFDVLGWRPETSLSQGIEAVLQDERTH